MPIELKKEIIEKLRDPVWNCPKCGRLLNPRGILISLEKDQRKICRLEFFCNIDQKEFYIWDEIKLEAGQ